MAYISTKYPAPKFRDLMWTRDNHRIQACHKMIYKLNNIK